MLNNFYFIDELVHNENKISATIRINQEHEILKAHFPQQAVVPGVCMLEMLKDVLSTAFKKKFQLKSSSVVKFLTPFTPQQTLIATYSIQFTEMNSEWICDAGLSFGETTFLIFKGVYHSVS